MAEFLYIYIEAEGCIHLITFVLEYVFQDASFDSHELHFQDDKKITLQGGRRVL